MMKEKDDSVQYLNFDDETFLDSAERKFEAGDYLGALTVLNKRARFHEPSADAAALYADIYSALEIYPLCADAWFRFLDGCNEADFGEGYEGLAEAFENLGDELQAQLYYERAYGVDIGETFHSVLEEIKKPQLRLVYSKNGGVDDSDALHKGLNYIRYGDLEKARATLSEIPPESVNFAPASGLVALCMLLDGDADGAAAECRRLLAERPDDISTLTTYCAVLGAQGDSAGAREIGLRLAELKTDSAEDQYRVATALCETGLDEEAYCKLKELLNKMPYSDDVLWFYAVAAYKVGRRDEAIASLDKLTTIYPRKAVARHYLYALRRQENPELGYFYSMPEELYEAIAKFFMLVNGAKSSDTEQFADMPEIEEYFRLAFDHLDGRDEKLQYLASRVAVACRYDGVIREVLLDYTLDEALKFSILRDLTLRNEENSYGVVIYNFYREFFTHKLELSPRKRRQFLSAFAAVYARYSLVGEDGEEKLVRAAESVNRVMIEAGEEEFFSDEKEMSAVIFREARLPQAEHKLSAIAQLFDADLKKVKKILDILI